MAIVVADIKGVIASDLEEYGEWSTAANSALEKNLFFAMRDYWELRDWSFKMGTGSVTTVAGTQGPYDAPADFDGLIPPENISRYFDYDRYSMPPTVPDGSYGQRFDITWNRATNELYFRGDPGDGAKTLYYLRKLLTVDDLATYWPDEAQRYLIPRTKYYCVVNSEDLANAAAMFEKMAKDAYASILNAKRRSESRSDGRNPRDVYGDPIASQFAWEGDGPLC